MSTTKKTFKVGDRIKNNGNGNSGSNAGQMGVVSHVDSNGHVSVKYDQGTTGSDNAPYEAYDLLKSFKANFLLQYDLDRDPVELYETMEDVKKRITVLVEKRHDLKKDSIKVYEIKKEYKVKLHTLFNFISVK